jgi:arginine repressor
MFVKPTVQTLRSIYSLSQQSAWKEIDKLFEDELQRTLLFLAESRDDVALRQMQGRAQFIREFLDTVNNSQKSLEKLKETTL